jgi:hypothetical protein
MRHRRLVPRRGGSGWRQPALGSGKVALASAPALCSVCAGLWLCSSASLGRPLCRRALHSSASLAPAPACRALLGFARPVVHFFVSPPNPPPGGLCERHGVAVVRAVLALQPPTSASTGCGRHRFGAPPFAPSRGLLGATSLPYGRLLAVGKSLRGAGGRLRPGGPPRRPWGAPLVWIGRRLRCAPPAAGGVPGQERASVVALQNPSRLPSLCSAPAAALTEPAALPTGVITWPGTRGGRGGPGLAHQLALCLPQAPSGGVG